MTRFDLKFVIQYRYFNNNYRDNEIINISIYCSAYRNEVREQNISLKNSNNEI